jgi:hypothetical protein
MIPDAKRMARMRLRRKLDLVPVQIAGHPPLDVPRKDAEEAYKRLLKAAEKVEPG